MAPLIKITPKSPTASFRFPNVTASLNDATLESGSTLQDDTASSTSSTQTITSTTNDSRIINRSISSSLLTKRLTPQFRGSLYNGARFKGAQANGSRNYPVEVIINNVDLNQSLVSGYLKISNLVDVSQ